MAARLYNAGQASEAHAKIRDAEASFHEAKVLRPKEPQAFVNIATTMLNAQKFDDAIKYWKAAGALMPAGRARDWAQGQAKWAAYGKISTKRDRVYAQGQGNLTQALVLIRKQLQIYPEFPALHHDKATVHAMLSALEANATAEAIEEFELEQQTAFRAWRAGLRQGGAPCCEECGGVVNDWPAHLAGEGSGRRGALRAVDWLEGPAEGERYGEGGVFLDGGAYVARFEGVAVSGDDGVIVDEAGCHIFLASSGYWAHAAGNLQMLELWRGPGEPDVGAPYHAWHDHHRGRFPNSGKVAKPAKVGKAASIVQFAATSYFHFMTEVLGRLLVLLRKGVLDDPEVRLLAPATESAAKRGGAKGGFIIQALEILAGDVLRTGRVTWLKVGGRPDVRLRAETLYFANWRLPAHPGADGSHCATPRSLLQLVAGALQAPAAEQDHPGEESRSLVYLSRTGQAMRGKLADEDKLRRGLSAAAAAARPPLSFQRLGGEGTLPQQMEAFRRARAVVGVHGGALTNLLFCAAGTHAFEIGFRSPLAGHYRHLAAVAGLRYTLLPLRADARGMGASEVRLVDLRAALAAVRAAVVGGGRTEL